MANTTSGIANFVQRTKVFFNRAGTILMTGMIDELRVYNHPLRNACLLTILSFALIGCDLSGSQPIAFQSRVDVAQRMLIGGQYDSAYTLLDEVSRDHGSQPAAHLAVGDAYLRGGAHFKARNAFNQAIKGGTAMKGQLGLGRVALAQNNAKDAFERFNLVLATEPDNQVALNGRGVAFDLQGQHKQARAEYFKVLAVNPTNLDALNNLALSNAIGGQGQEAVQTLQELTQSQLTDVNLRHNLAIAYYVVGLEDAAYKLATSELSRNEAKRMFRSVHTYRASKR